MDLSLNMRALIAQQLIPLADGSGRRAAIEILINTPLVGDLIRKGEVHKLKELMTRSTEQGMQTFDMCLFNLLKKGQIAEETALAAATNPNSLVLKIKGVESADDWRIE